MGATALTPGSESSDQPNRVVLVFLTFNVGLWLQKTGADHPWSGLPVLVPRNALALFCVAVQSIVGNGQTTLFLSDRWLQEISKPFQADLQKSGQAAHCGSSSNGAEMGRRHQGRPYCPSAN